MGIRTVAQYLESLRDGRKVYWNGEKVEDVTKHPVLRGSINLSSMFYKMAEDPRYKDLLINHTEQGEPYSFMFHPARSSQDLLRRREIIKLIGRSCLGLGAGAKPTGTDVLNSLTVVSRRMDRALKTRYSERVEAFRQYLYKNDLSIVAAVTDVKGDRGLRPADQKPHKDFFVRVVEERKDGIVVRGGKFHISHTPSSNEIFACPSRAMRAEDKDYAVAFAVPVNTPGVVVILGTPGHGSMNIDDFPLSACRYTAEPLLVFDNVFVPWERVFLYKEWQYAGEIANMFGTFHRLFADTYKYAELEILTGVAKLLAKANGLENVSHVRDKLSWMPLITETVNVLGEAACEKCIIEPDSGLAYPNPIYSNAAKYTYADNFHQMCKIVQDIGGGIVADFLSFKNFTSAETGPYMEKYFRGNTEMSTEDRLRTISLASDAVSSWHQTTTIHAEGSLAAQKLTIYRQADWDRYEAIASRAGNLKARPKHAVTDSLLKFPPDLPL